MGDIKRPLTVWAISCLYIVVGVLGFAYHLPQLLAHRSDSIWVEFVRLLAIFIGIFMLLGYNWARWLAVAWMGFHVLISLPDYGQLVMHTMILALIVYGLFRFDAEQFFLHSRSRSTPRP